jgi:plastocyanin
MKKYILGLILLFLVIAGSCDAQGQAGSKEKVKLTKSQFGNVINAETIIDIKNFSFQPSNLTISPGTTVTWHNQDGIEHTITSDTGLFDSGVINAGKKFSFDFNTPGNYKYHCSIHPNMRGTITVSGPASAISMPTGAMAAAVLMPQGPTAQQEPATQLDLIPGITQEQAQQLAAVTPPGLAIAKKTSSKSKGKPSWSEKSLDGQTLTQTGAQQAPILQLNLSQVVSQSQSQAQTQNQVMQYSQYYQIAPKPPSQPLTAPAEYKLSGQEPTMLYFGMTQKAVPYTQYQTYATQLGMNSLWIKGPYSWTQYATVPQGALLSMIATSPSGGFGYLYEVYPDGTLDKNGYKFYNYNQIGFYADQVGQHLLFFVIDGQPSNIVTIDVVAYQPQPPPIYNYASVTISSDWLNGYDVYVDGNYKGTEGLYGQPPGMVTVTVPGNQYHAIAVYGNGFSFSDSRFFNAGWAYTLNV